MPYFNTEFNTENIVEFEAKFISTSQDVFKTDFETTVVSNNVPTYKGEYEVIPKVDAQTLETAKKMMEKDLNIKAIPIYEVSNEAGGQTFIIAKE